MPIPDTWLLAMSLLVLAAGPLIYQSAQAARFAGSTLAALDGFVFVAIGGLVVLHVIPESVALGGWSAILAGLVGLVVPTLLEHRLHGRARQVHTVALLLGLAALALHAFMDGLVLGGGHEGEHGHRMLPMAVVLHRLPEGLMIWFLVRPLYGLRLALATLGLVAVSTLAGFSLSEAVAQAIEHQGRGLFQALVAGSLLHVVMHRSYPLGGPAAGHEAGRLQAGLGGVGGLVLLWAITRHAEPAMVQAGAVFCALALKSAPALLLAYVAAGLVYGLLPRASVAWIQRGRALSQALRGMAFGLPLPICSCGVVPLYRSLVLQGVPVPAAMAFLIATPELSLDAVLLTLPLLGGPFTLARLLCAAAVALAIGWGLGRLARPMSGAALPQALSLNGDPAKGLARLKAGLGTGLGEVVEATAPWILLGLGIAAIAEPVVEDQWLAYLPAGLEVALFALLGIPTYVCASGATPLAAVLIHKGVSPGAALAFLLTGPATNLTTFGLLSRLHGRRLALAFGGAMALLAVALGLLVNLFIPRVEAFPADPVAGRFELGLQELCLAAVAGLFLLALLRRGPRGLAAELSMEEEEDPQSEHEHPEPHPCAQEPCCR